jgi:hypothetical protein
MSDDNRDAHEREKRSLIIEVLDKGLLGIGEVGILASMLRSDGGRGHCGCDSVCDDCKAKCGCLA